MRSIKEIYEMKEQGLYPCRFPRCLGYGNTADRKWGVVCKDHTSPCPQRAPRALWLGMWMGRGALMIEGLAGALDQAPH
jgi:hypothetical protein